jgi:hypothetical protein
MGWFDVITNPINNAWDSAVDSNPITSGVSEAIHNAGESSGINDTVDTVAPIAAALAVAYATGYLDPSLLGAGAGMTDAELLAADAAIGAGEGAGAGAGVGAGAIGAGEGAGFVGPSASLASASGDAFLPGALAGDAATGWPAWAQSALTGAGKGMLTNAGVNLLTGKPITPQGLLLSGLSGGVGGGIANLTDSSWLGGLGALGTNLLLNKSLSPSQMAGSFISSGFNGTGNTGTSGSSNTSGTNTGTDTSGTPKGKFLKGQQIALPLDNLAALPTTTDTSTANADPARLQEIQNQLQLQQIQNAATGGIIHKAEGGDLPMSSKQLRGQAPQRYNPFGLRGAASFSLPSLADGGGMPMQERTLPEAHNPEFFSEGGLNSMENRYVTGDGDGTSDSIPAMLANGEFVIPADIVSGLGNGSNDSGAKVLDEFLEVVRAHKQKHDAKHLPPDSNGPLAYLLQAKQKVRA